MRYTKFIFLTALLIMFSLSNAAYAMQVFYTDFETGIPVEISGPGILTGTEGFSSHGFDSYFLRNSSLGNPAGKTTLHLTGLPAHNTIDLSFLVAFIDSWDGDGPGYAWGPDFFNVLIDGMSIFDEFICNDYTGAQSYIPSPGAELVHNKHLGFNSLWADSAYDMGMEHIFKNITHSNSELTIECYASGLFWQGGLDESWAIDNIEVNVNIVPLPSTLLFMFSGLLGLLSLRKNLSP